jgi:hypothetical protein
MLLALAACSPSARQGTDGLPDAPSTIAPDAGPSVCFEPSVTGTAMAGNGMVQDCAIWNHVADMTGQVTLTRTATTFTLSFANGLVFTGAISGTSVTLTHVEPHSFSDNCGWQATETLTGTIDPTSCALSLSYAYAEMVVTDNGACATPCSGTADLMFVVTPILL